MSQKHRMLPSGLFSLNSLSVCTVWQLYRGTNTPCFTNVCLQHFTVNLMKIESFCIPSFIFDRYMMSCFYTPANKVFKCWIGKTVCLSIYLQSTTPP